MTTDAPTGYTTHEERSWALFAHFGGIVLSFIAPLVALQVKGQQSATVARHATEALNFQITWVIALVIAVIARVCSFGVLGFLPLLVWVANVVFSVIGGLRANEGRLYRYPIALRLVN